ncbi:hypothetical protein tb265_38950 [Gemmatimonadetes bacterium T265]|nr:hypothetical protein tb265_38950 [Gemmatimonadetes bacterium T265]
MFAPPWGDLTTTRSMAMADEAQTLDDLKPAALRCLNAILTRGGGDEVALKTAMLVLGVNEYGNEVKKPVVNNSFVPGSRGATST